MYRYIYIYIHICTHILTSWWFLLKFVSFYIYWSLSKLQGRLPFLISLVSVNHFFLVSIDMLVQGPGPCVFKGTQLLDLFFNIYRVLLTLLNLKNTFQCGSRPRCPKRCATSGPSAQKCCCWMHRLSSWFFRAATATGVLHVHVCERECIYLYICTYIYVHIYMYIHICIYTYMYVYEYIYMCIYVKDIFIYVYMLHSYIYMHICICICTYTHIYTCEYVYIYIHIYIRIYLFM